MRRSPLIFAVLAAIAARVPAQQYAQGTIPVRTVTPGASSNAGVFSNITDVRHLQNSSVVVNDTIKRQVLFLDEALKKVSIVIDNSGNMPRRYGTAGARLIPGEADATMFFQPSSQAFSFIGGSGKVERNVQVPGAANFDELSGPAFGTPGLDATGRGIVYRGTRTPRPGARQDSAPVLRTYTGMKIVDTIALMALPILTSAPPKSAPSGAFVMLPAADEWLIVPDGTVAVLRMKDYHVDWYHDNGSISGTPKMPVELKKIAPEDKPRIADSVRMLFTPPIDAADVPDYYPPARPGEFRSDLEGNIWILGYNSSPATGLVYDVVNRLGVIIERVQLPAGRTLAGFGRRPIVYMRNQVSVRDLRLERGKVNR